MEIRPARALLLCALFAAGAAGAQTPAAEPHDMGAMSGMSATPATSVHSGATGARDPSSEAFRQADATMMQGMSAPYTGDTDQDFVSHMLPHHQGAVDMAHIQLKYGKDPMLRQLAHNIIRDQEKEIALMRQWQAKHPPRANGG